MKKKKMLNLALYHCNIFFFGLLYAKKEKKNIFFFLDLTCYWCHVDQWNLFEAQETLWTGIKLSDGLLQYLISRLQTEFVINSSYCKYNINSLRVQIHGLW